ncbi:MAG: carboxypeptidase regulatory-like domain-containing protein, partial [Kofleriaceae bacterium]
VVFQSPAGEHSATTGADGAYAISLPVGTYRAFVRDDTVLSIGRTEPERLPGAPSAETAGVPDEALMPLVIADADRDGIDLSVIRGGTIRGQVVDRNGRPIAGALIRARGEGFRPALGTDLAESDADGSFELRVPANRYVLEATHARYAGVVEPELIEIEPGDVHTATVTLTAGCVISGRVAKRDGRAGDGAIERQWGSGELEFAPAGQISPDGAFRWVTTEETEVVLRAWPWKSPPSPAQRFACRDGARFDGVVFQLPDRAPDIDGVLVDRTGAPVSFAYVDLAPLDPGGIAQQERTDAEGRWGVFQMPAGRYQVSAYAPGRGIATSIVSSPQSQVRLQLGGTGRIEGTAQLLQNTSIELMLVGCVNGNAIVPVPQERRLIAVTGGRFTIEDVPACDLRFLVTWKGRHHAATANVPAGGTVQVEVPVGPPRKKTVHGVVRDEAGRPVASAQVAMMFEDDHAVATTDSSGRYTIETFSGALLVAGAEGGSGNARVGLANVDREQVDIVLIPDSDE